MCTFNTLVLPRSTSIDDVNRVAADALGQQFAPQNNASIEAAFGADAQSFVKASGHCDCGMGLTKLAAPADDLERDLRRLEAAGWSEGKIERWREQRAAASARREAAFANRGGGAPPYAAQWTAFVRRLLDERVVAWVGLFTHTYRGSYTSERIAVSEVRKHAGVSEERLAEIEEDIGFVFAR